MQVASAPSWVGLVLAAATLALACSEDASGGPGDRWFQGVVTGTTGAGQDVTGAFDLVLLDPRLAEDRVPGSPGSDPDRRDAVAFCYYPDGSTAVLQGDWDPGGYLVRGDGWTFGGTFDGGITRGTFVGPGDARGRYAGTDTAEQGAARFCGSYGGSGSGTWNFVVREDGVVTGSFDGTIGGELDGSANGDAVELRWSGGRGEARGNGTASGTLGTDNRVTGGWSGTYDGMNVSGSWDGSACFGPPPPQRVPEDEPCPCGREPGTDTVVWCCQGKPCCSAELVRMTL